MKQRKISHADLAAALQMDDGEVNALICATNCARASMMKGTTGNDLDTRQ